MDTKLLPLLAFVTLMPLASPGATLVWNGGGADDNWSTAGNWTGVAFTAGDLLQFGGGTRLTPVNNLAADTLVGGIDFTNNTLTSTAAFTLSGSRITLGGNITTLAAASTSFNATINDQINLDLLLNGTRTITVNNNGDKTHNLTINGVISDGGGGFGLTTAGGARLTLAAANTYSGTTTLGGTAVVVLNHANALPGGTATAGGTSGLTFAGGTLGLGAGDFTRGLGTGAHQVQWTGAGGFAAFDANRVVNLGGSGATVMWNAGGFVPTNSALIFGYGNGADTQDSTHTVDFQNPVDLNGGTRTVTVNDGNGTTNALIDAVMSGGIINSTGTGALTKNGSGTLSLTAAGTYTGQTYANGGVLLLNHANALPGGIGATGGTSNLRIGGNGLVGLGTGDFTRALGTGVTQVQWTGAGGFAAYNADRVVNLGGAGATVTWGTGSFVPNGSSLYLGANSATHTVDFQNPIDLGSTVRTVEITNAAAGAVDAVISGAISGTGGLSKNGDGTLALTSTNSSYTGQTNLTSNITMVSKMADYGQNSSLGQGTAGVPILMSTQFRTGTLEYTGSGDSSDRTFQLGTSTATHNLGGGITSSGTGALVLDAPAFNVAVAGVTAARVLTLSGGNADLNTISGVIQNTNGATGTLGVTKTGTGTWVLSGANTYSGATTLTTGTLHLNNAGSGGTSSAIGTSALSIGSGTTIDNSSGTPITLSTANAVTWGGAFTFGGTNDLSFANGTSIAAGSRTITLNGTGRTLTFGTLSISSATTQTVNDGGSGNKLVLSGLVLAESNQARAQTFAGTAAIEITGSVTDGAGTGADSLSYTGSSTLTLGGSSNTYTGTTTMNNAAGTLTLAGSSTTSSVTLTAGRLNVNHANAIGAGTLTLTAGTLDNTSAADITVATANSVVIGGNLAFGGTRSLSFANGTASIGGNRTITLNGTSKTLTFGTVSFTSANTITVNDAGSGNKLVLGGMVLGELNQGRIQTFNGNAAVDITGSITNGPGTGADGLSYTGTSILTLSGAGTYTGATTVNGVGGTLRTTATGSLGTASLAIINGTAELNNTAQTIGVLTFGSSTNTAQTSTATLTLASGTTLTQTGSLVANDNVNSQPSFLNGGTIDINGTRIWGVDDTASVDADLTVSSIIQNTGAVGTFTKNGTGRLVLTGNNTFADIFAVADGIVRIQHANALGSTVGGTTVNTGDALEIAGGITVTGEALLLNGTGVSTTGALRILSGTNAWTGTIDLAGDARIQADAGSQLTVSAITAGGTGRDVTFGGDGDHIANGRIGSGGTNPVDQVLKDGAGTLTLNNTANDFTGTVTINDGTLRLGASEVIPNAEVVAINKGTFQLNGQAETITSLTLGASTTTVAGNTANVIDTPSGGILRLTGNSTYNAGSVGFENGQATISANLDVNNASRTFTVNDNTTLTEELVISGTISNSGATAAGLTKGGTGTLVISATNTYNGTTTINAGTLKLGANNALPDTPLTLDQRLGGVSTLDIAGRSDAITTLTLSGNSTTVVNSTSQIIDSTGGGVLKLGGSVTYNIGAATFHNSMSTISANVDLNGANRTFTINDSTNATTDVIVSGTIINTGATAGITKAGAGTLALTAANTYDGITTVSAGALQVGSSGTGQTGTGAVTAQTSSTIFGTGTVRGSTFTAASGSTIHAGDTTASNSYGTLTFTPVSGSGSIQFQSGSSVILGINPGGTSDLLNFVGTGTNTLTFNANLTVGPATLAPTNAEVFNLLDWTGLTSAPTFASHFTFTSQLFGNGDEATGLDLPDISGTGYAWDISAFTTNGSIAIVVVPEPGRALLLMLGLASIMARRRRR
jgi:autotransporter-associated beta strand protein